MNGFLDLAERQVPAPVKARSMTPKHAEARSGIEREWSERDHQLRAWNQWRRERLGALLGGPHGHAVWELLQFLKAMTVRDAPALISIVNRGQWQRTDPETRFEVLALVDAHIIELREAHGWLPFDDGLTEDEPTAFQQIRDLLT
jgi:hypothetical protein